MFSRLAPSATRRLRQASAAAPAPEVTILTFSIFLPVEMQRVLHRGGDDDGGAMLVVVEDRDLHALLQPRLDVEAFRRLDVLQIDAAEGRLERRDHLDHPLDLVASISMSNTSMPANFLNRTALPSITGLDGQRADIAEAEHGGAVGDHGDEVLPRGQLGGLRRIGGDRLAGGGDARRIGEREVVLVAERLGRLDFELSGLAAAVIDERLVAQVVGQVGHH